MFYVKKRVSLLVHVCSNNAVTLRVVAIASAWFETSFVHYFLFFVLQSFRFSLSCIQGRVALAFALRFSVQVTLSITITIKITVLFSITIVISLIALAVKVKVSLSLVTLQFVLSIG